MNSCSRTTNACLWKPQTRHCSTHSFRKWYSRPFSLRQSLMTWPPLSQTMNTARIPFLRKKPPHINKQTTRPNRRNCCAVEVTFAWSWNKTYSKNRSQARTRWTVRPWTTGCSIVSLKPLRSRRKTSWGSFWIRPGNNRKLKCKTLWMRYRCCWIAIRRRSWSETKKKREKKREKKRFNKSVANRREMNK